MHICLYHPTMGHYIKEMILASFPDLTVSFVQDTTTDPQDVDTIDVLLANRFPSGLLERCHQLQWLHLTGTGADHVLSGRPQPHLVITNSASVPARAVAEFVCMGLLAFAKEAIQLVQQQQHCLWQLPNARLLAGSHLVLVGLGRIGSEIARRAQAFDMQVTAITRHAAPSMLVHRTLPPEQLRTAATQADYLVLAVPATPETYHLVDASVLDALPASAAVINISRSSVLDIPALVQALQAGRLRHALLDVHDEEPLPVTSPLWKTPHLWITPHCAYRFPEEEQEVGRIFVHNLGRFLRGEDLLHRIDLALLAAPDQLT